MKLNELIESNHFEQRDEVCPGCQNKCQVRCYTFANGQTYFSGNNCERVYSNRAEGAHQGVNLFDEKYRLLFHFTAEGDPAAKRSYSASGPVAEGGLTIGIPRGLGMYEDFPFWRTFFACCGIRTVLSGVSTNRLYEKGVRTIVADNICFPAKLMHGHVMDLVSKGVDRIFYPWVVYERAEDTQAKNSFNCPVVSGYSDVLKSAIRSEEKYGIPLDAPTVSFRDETLLREELNAYIASLPVMHGVHNVRQMVDAAVTQAIEAQQAYLDALERRNLAVFEQARQEGRMVILLAARPYHIDPLIQHKIADAIAAMGIDVLTENIAVHAGQGVYGEINALCQWAYPNRIFKAAHFVAQSAYTGLHMVQLTSFGCGPDAFILDEVRGILNRYGKNLTVLKIDDVNNIGSLRLRVRSLVESVKGSGPLTTDKVQKSEKAWTTKPFGQEDRERVILAPYFAEGYNEFLPTIFRLAGYKMVSLPMATQADAEEGLRVANNDICYPATIVVGSLLRALKSGQYDLRRTAVAITQTGGQCRASNYYSLIKNALVTAGMSEVPVISVAIGPDQRNNQPGFTINWRKLIRPTLEALFFADALAKLYYPAAPRENKTGEARRMYDHYLQAVQPLLAERNYKGMRRMMAEAVQAFSSICDRTRPVTQVGLVGEIYVKYNSFSNKQVVQWLIDHGVEVVPPAITGFFSTSIPNAFIFREQHIRRDGMKPWQARLVNTLLNHYAHTYDRLCRPFPYYRPFTDIMDIWRSSRQVINSAADFGEGWFLPGEICELARSGVRKVVSLQPFGCIANHIISKGIERRYKDLFPDLSLLFLDFDAGTSEANVANRLHFMLEN
ncbi:MAG: 2-hydroxyacyl-CoA dehydratase [Paludibacteraceae bacterium]|nr:2-hydroxyacyl-CoA dehydratase [Paludibacteraceae bacterium]